jgi:4-aminobutyrate aminotransferase / (S)-3-amino-2-methylpropionate transaminase / 5-aminovalerate transaminase
MHKTVVVMGAGRPQIPVIARAHRLGYRVVAPDRNPEAPGLALADHPLPGVSTHDPAAIVDALRALERRGVRVHGVLTVAVEASHSAARVCEELGLPGVGVAAAQRATDKLARLEALSAAGVSCPRFGFAHKLEEARPVAERIGYPVVLKPTRAAGSLGVVRCADEAELAAAWALTSAASPDGVLLEEYLVGTEHSSESLVLDGRVHTTGFSDRNYDTKHLYPPHVLENGDTLPTALRPEVLARTLREVEAAIRALGVGFGPAKGDLLVTEDGRPVVLEMATRLSGDYFCTHTVPLHNGTDIVSAALQQCVGDPVDLRLLEPQHARGVALRYLWPRDLPGAIRAVRRWDECAALPGVTFLTWEPYWLDRGAGPGVVLARPTCHRERAASVMASGATREQAVALAEYVARSVEIEIEPLPASPAPTAQIDTPNRRIATALPAPATRAALERLRVLEPRSMGGQPPVFWSRAREASVEDAHGNRWIDLSSGVLVANTGHTPPEVVAALRRELDRGLIYSYGFPTQARLAAGEALHRLLPRGHKAFLLTTGSEAVENVLKLMRIEGRRRGGAAKRVIVSFERAFHGRTLGAQLAGGIPFLKDWIGPSDPGFVQVPFPDAYWGERLDFAAFEQALARAGVAPADVCGVLMESYQGGTGQFAPEPYVRALRTWCDRHGALLAFDEVQSGLGRTGARFAFEHYGVEPDLFAMGKALAGGLPLAASAGRAELLDACDPGSMTSTWSAHALACAAAAANLERLERLALVERARELGAHLHARVAEWPRRFACVGGAAGRGLMAAVYVAEPGTRTPDAGRARRVVDTCVEQGVLLFAPVGAGPATLKLCPPLVITREQLDESLDVLEAALAR